MLGEYILDGFKVGVIVCAMLIGFVGIITLINNIFLGVIGISFQELLGYIFSPFAFFMGIPWSECVSAASIMATKIVSNEFVAMMQLGDIASTLSTRTNSRYCFYIPCILCQFLLYRYHRRCC